MAAVFLCRASQNLANILPRNRPAKHYTTVCDGLLPSCCLLLSQAGAVCCLSLLQYVRTLEHIEATPKSGTNSMLVWMLEPDSPHGKAEQRGFAKDEALKLLKMKVVRLGADKVTLHPHMYCRQPRDVAYYHFLRRHSSSPDLLSWGCCICNLACWLWPSL